MNVREIDQFLEQWEMNARDLHRRMNLAPTPRERALRQAQELARRLAAGPRLDDIVHGGGTGTRPPHHRTMGRCLRGGRSGGPDIRACRKFPPALGEAEQAALTGAVREYLQTPGLNLRLVNLPGYGPDFNADEAVWGWAREEATGNLCLGTMAAVLERVSSFLTGLASRKDEVRRRCRTTLQSRAEELLRAQPSRSPIPAICTSHLGFGLGPWRPDC